MGFCLLSVTGLVFGHTETPNLKQVSISCSQFNSNLVFQYNTYSGPSTPEPWIIHELRFFVVGRIAIFLRPLLLLHHALSGFAVVSLTEAYPLLQVYWGSLSACWPTWFLNCLQHVRTPPLPVYSRPPSMISPPACPQACGPRPS